MQSEFEAGDIVQITDEDHHWFPALIIVSEPKSFGIQGYLHVVTNDREKPNGQAYIRLESRQIEKVGHAALILSHHDEE